MSAQPAPTPPSGRSRVDAAPSTLVRAIAAGEVLRVRLTEFTRAYGALDVNGRLRSALDEVEALLRYWRRQGDESMALPFTAGPTADATQSLLEDPPYRLPEPLAGELAAIEAAHPPADQFRDRTPATEHPVLRLGPGGDFTRDIGPDSVGRLTDVTG